LTDDSLPVKSLEVNHSFHGCDGNSGFIQTCEVLDDHEIPTDLPNRVGLWQFGFAVNHRQQISVGGLFDVDGLSSFQSGKNNTGLRRRFLLGEQGWKRKWESFLAMGDLLFSLEQTPGRLVPDKDTHAQAQAS